MITLHTGPTIEVLCNSISLHSIHCVVTSPPYWKLRQYGDEGNEIGQENTPEQYIENLVYVFKAIKQCLRPDGTVWLNLGDTRTGGGRGGNPSTSKHHKQGTNIGSLLPPMTKVKGVKGKQLLGLPWRVALALQTDGWFLRSDIIWHVPNKMPESVRDRPSNAHEYLFLLSQSPKYYYDKYAIREPASQADKIDRKPKKFGGNNKHDGYGTRLASGNDSPVYLERNKRDVWKISTQGFKGAHFAAYPEKLVEPCILAGTSEHGCCSLCGKPYQRLVEVVRIATRPGENTKIRTGRSRLDLFAENDKPVQLDSSIVGNRDPERHISKAIQKGWSQDCSCENSQVVPCTVLDPFSGSGTTGVVAKRLGRNYIGVDLYEKYNDMARKRIGI